MPRALRRHRAAGLAAVEAVALVLAARAIARLRRREREQRRRIDDLAHLALVDGLTGLRNRRAFDEELGRALGARSRGVTPERLAIAMIDIRGLKGLNDSLGHQEGDRRLRTLATVMRAEVREADSVYRVGGDEFMVILPGQTADEARRLLGRLQQALVEDGIDISAGIADASGTANADSLVRRADRALVAAKHDSPGVVVWSPGLDRITTEPADVPAAPPADETG